MQYYIVNILNRFIIPRKSSIYIHIYINKYIPGLDDILLRGLSTLNVLNTDIFGT